VRFGDHAAGSPFVTYAFTAKGVNVRHYAVAVGDRLEDSWPLELFENGDYHFRVHGPNGFFREFKGNVKDPKVQASLSETSEGYARINIRSDGIDERVEVIDRAYGFDKFSHSMRAGDSFEHTVKTPESRGWYDVSVTAAGFPHFEKRYAGRVETGRWSITDPAMG
jgi:phospholipase C